MNGTPELLANCAEGLIVVDSNLGHEAEQLRRQTRFLLDEIRGAGRKFPEADTWWYGLISPSIVELCRDSA